MKIVLALDNMTDKAILELVSEFKDSVIYKLNDSFFRYGWNLYDNIRKLGGEVFLDLKFHDIPNTVANYLKTVADKEVFMCNLHCSGGRETMQLASKMLSEYCEKNNKRKPVLLGVTVLTSLNEQNLVELGFHGVSVMRCVEEMGKLSKSCGLDGVVCSPQEICLIKKACGKDFLVVTPGVRPVWASAGDQKRIATPAKALECGSDYLVVGRPVIQSQDYGKTRREAIEDLFKDE